MVEQRVNELPIEGEEGVLYIIEPGTVSYIWQGGEFRVYEQRAPFIPYYAVFADGGVVADGD